MSEERIINLLEHEKHSILELKAMRQLILVGSMPYPRKESKIRVNAISRLIQKMQKHGQ